MTDSLLRDIEATLETITASLPGGGERRDGQLEMAKAVGQAIDDRFHLVARAGTGTGKSLAYLVPVIASGRTAIVATATKALQDQLAEKDLPFLEQHIDFTWAVLKGRSNYICRQRIAELGDDHQLSLDVEVNHDTSVEVDLILEWAEETVVGDRAELPVEPSPQAWSAVSVGSDECPGAAKCPNGAGCFAEAAKARASEADLVVVNTHLYGIDLASERGLLPEHDVVVIDEAHQLEDIISATAGVEMSAHRFRDVSQRARAIIADDSLADRIAKAGDDLDAALVGTDDMAVTLDRDTAIGKALTEGRRALDMLLGALRVVGADVPIEVAARKDRAQQAATTLITELDRIGAMTETDVSYVAGPPRRRVLRVAPIDVGETLQNTLWKKRSVILTSATVPDVFPEQVGLGPDSFKFIDVGSPFDYEHSALLYCAADLPAPRDPGYEEALHAELERLIVAAGGRTLALFTSWRATEAAVQALRPRLPWKILAQGELPKPALLEQFSADPEACLFATMSFWQGVDVPGQSLSLVTIDKLPFPRPDDPLLNARRERAGRGAFRKVDLPRAAMMLAQGTGRLIRSTSDQGVVAILDKRLATAKSYRWDLLAALPPYRRTRDREDAEAFLRRLRDA